MSSQEKSDGRASRHYLALLISTGEGVILGPGNKQDSVELLLEKKLKKQDYPEPCLLYQIFSI